MTTAFELLHRNVQRKLWDMKWEELRPIQDQAIRHLLMRGGDTVIASPTASGKTEAAFLPVLSAIADAPTGSVRAMYVGPLKALINDQFRRVEDLCGRLEMPVCKWHGDVGDGAKHKLLDSPGGVLLITPESLEAMLVRRPTAMPHLFSRLSFVVIDEMHAFMGTERGAQLVSQLHRLNERAGCDPIRIGLSATLGDPEAALRWLRPGGPAATLIHDAATQSSILIKVRGIWQHRDSQSNDDAMVDDGDPVFRELARAILIACHTKTNLVFANAKSKIELVADALASEVTEMKLADEVVVHHGSLSRERRLYAEDRLRSGRPCTAVCSNTLELGIDIGEIDEVVQVSAPWSVASLVQRVGRSGRRHESSRVLRGFFVEQVPDEQSDVWDRLHLDLLQGVAIIELMLEKFVEPPALGRAHLSTLVHQCLAFLAETGGSTALALFQRLKGSGAFGKISQADFVAILHELGRHDLIEQMGDGSLILGLAGQGIVEHYTFFAAFNAAEELRVVHGGDEIGTIARPPAPGEHMVLAGRRWRVESIEVDRREILVTPARGLRPPTFSPSHGIVHPTVHAKMKALLLGSDKPTYLDSVAFEILQGARVEAARQGGFRPAARAIDGGVRLFVFGGSKVQQTLSLVLSMAGREVDDNDIGFDVRGNLESVIAALRGFATKPDMTALADHADRVLCRRELGPEKFDRFVAPHVWQRAYAREELDESGAVSAALLLADALTVKAPAVTSLPTESTRPSQQLAAASSAPMLPPSETPPRLPRQSIRPAALERLADLCDTLVDLPVSGPLPERVVLIENEAHAHTIRRELARNERGSSLTGTKFVTAARLATQILEGAGIAFERGEEAVRTSRLRVLFRDPPPLRYFKARQLCETPGWDRAFARTIGDLEAAALTPSILACTTDDPRVRDVGDLWSALDEMAGISWTRARIVREAARALAENPSLVPHQGPMLVAFTGHESRVDVDLTRAIPRATLVPWAARPRRASHAERIRTLLGVDAARVWEQPSAPPEATSELGLLKAFLFDGRSVTAISQRSHIREHDGTVQLEQHDGVDAEIDAALTWVQQEISRNETPLEEIALLVPYSDPLAGMLADRLVDLDLPTHVVGGLPATSTPVCARLLALLRALTSFLHRDALIELLPAVRVAREPRNHFTRNEVLEVFGALGGIGGARSGPEGALEWPIWIAERIARIESVLPRDGQGGAREEEMRALKRARDLLRLLEEPMAALTRAAEPFIRGGPVMDLWPPLEAFLYEYVLAPDDDRRLVDIFAAQMRLVCAHPAISSIVGADTHRLLEETLLGIRLQSLRFGDPAITIATIRDAAGAPFTAVRILGIAEGMFPSAPLEDAILPDAHRRELRAYGLRTRSDRALAQLHALDRVVRNVGARIVLSAPKRDLSGMYREISSIGIEAAIALGRGGVTAPDANHLRHAAFTPAYEALEAARNDAPLREGTWQVRAARRRELPPRWAGSPHLDLDRGITLLDPKRGPDALDGIFPSNGWFPIVPGFARERPLSASRWRTFLECPHRFLLESLLNLKAPPDALDDGALDPLTYGRIFHTIAERFYQAHGDAFVKRTSNLEMFETWAQKIADEVFSESLEKYALTGGAVRKAQRERLRRDVHALLEIDWDLVRDRVAGVERAFGTDEALVLAVGSHAIYVRGYIDRIDIEEGVGVLRDLKTGKAKPRKTDGIDPGIDAQLALYVTVAKAMSQRWGLPQKLSAAYVYTAGVRHTERAFRDADYELLQASADTWLEMTTELAVARNFPRTANAKDCTFCRFKPVCGPAPETRAARVLESGGTTLGRFRTVRGQ